MREISRLLAGLMIVCVSCTAFITGCGEGSGMENAAGMDTAAGTETAAETEEAVSATTAESVSEPREESAQKEKKKKDRLAGCLCQLFVESMKPIKPARIAQRHARQPHLRWRSPRSSESCLPGPTALGCRAHQAHPQARSSHGQSSRQPAIWLGLCRYGLPRARSPGNQTAPHARYRVYAALRPRAAEELARQKGRT